MYKKFKMWLRFFFGFSRTEANGFVVLSFLMLFLLILPFFTQQFFYSQTNSQSTLQESLLLDSLLAQLNAVVEEENHDSISLQPFELNKVSAATLVSYGVPSYLADRIVKYRIKVRPFEEKEELLKIYGLDTTLYNKLQPYLLDITPQPKEKSTRTASSAEEKPPHAEYSSYDYPSKPYNKPLVPFNINTADTTQLKQIRGIGSTFAKRIIAFRDALGGFHHPKQLSEVYGLKSPALDSLLLYATIPQAQRLQQLAVNSLDAQGLAAHPYISRKQANTIVAYRQQHGKYLKATDLLQIRIFDSLYIEKIKPYLQFED